MIRIAIQTKGRLNEESIKMLSSIDIDIDNNKRKFLSKTANFPAEVLYLRDDDIPHVVESGTAQLGIVGGCREGVQCRDSVQTGIWRVPHLAGHPKRG